ncbi:MAG: hypothetical protein QM638_16125, partial [Nocardioides sp.]|uniref:hypothetical protein n=1 Tax=Nocardioides sp. TaxID=35761 RepID=UPI0039E3EEBF
MADDFKYHIDHHGSFQPPAELVAARQAYADGELDRAGLEATTSGAVHDLMLTQRRLAMLALSDGEFGRRNDLAAVYDHVSGFGDPRDEPGAVATLVGPGHAAEVRALSGTPVATGRLADAA